MSIFIEEDAARAYKVFSHPDLIGGLTGGIETETSLEALESALLSPYVVLIGLGKPEIKGYMMFTTLPMLDTTVWDAHTAILPEFAGACFAERDEAIGAMFQRGARRIAGFCPASNPAIAKAAAKHGFIEEPAVNGVLMVCDIHRWITLHMGAMEQLAPVGLKGDNLVKNAYLGAIAWLCAQGRRSYAIEVYNEWALANMVEPMQSQQRSLLC